MPKLTLGQGAAKEWGKTARFRASRVRSERRPAEPLPLAVPDPPAEDAVVTAGDAVDDEVCVCVNGMY
eukprot:COSAG02_NODE_469_length_21727_cov_64.506334_12_plen_68_part_00